MTVPEYAAVLSSITAVGGVFALVARAQYEKMRREITEEITRSRHDTIDRVIEKISEVEMNVHERVSKELYVSELGDLRRRVATLERHCKLSDG